MNNGAAIGGVLCAMMFVLLLGTVVGAVILRAAVSLCNKFLGADDSDGGVPEPSFGKAIGITFVTTLVNFVAGFMIGLVIGGAAAVGGADPQAGGIVAQLVSLPVGFLVMAGMLTLMLPTTFGRALLVALCHFLIVIVIVVVIVGIVVGIGLIAAAA